MPCLRPSFRLLLPMAILCALPLFANAADTAAFTDLPGTSAIAPAAEYLLSKGIVQGGKFNPSQPLTRAQAVKVLVAPIVPPDQLKLLTSSSYTDVPVTAWYMPYVEAAKVIGIVDPAPTFNPDKPVTKAGFIKMILIAKKIDAAKAFSDLKDPLSTDVRNTSDWFFPAVRYALASSMTAVSKEGLLSPSRELTRGDMALLYYRLDMYLTGRRTQALLSQTETDIGNVLQMLDQKNIEQAQFASARAVLAARGALAARPNESIVKGAVKISEGFQKLVIAYKAGVSGDLALVITTAKEAYALGEKAKSFSPGLSYVAEQMQTIAKGMADEARKAQALQPSSAQ